MIGFVDINGRALLGAEIYRNTDSPPHAINVWIDTGFTGELLLPHPMINSLGLRRSASVHAVLADGSQVQCPTYVCYLSWFDQLRYLEVIESQGQFPLLGVGLLSRLELAVNYRTGALELNAG